MSDLPEELARSMETFAKAVDKIDGLLQQLNGAPWQDLCRGLSPLESARMHLMAAYTVNTLFYMYLKTQGISASEHPVRNELERVKGYIRKVKEASQAAEKASVEEKRQLTLNSSAAHRFITHALGGADEGAAPQGCLASADVTAQFGPACDVDGAAAREAAAMADEQSTMSKAEQRVARQRVKAVEDAVKREVGALSEQMACEADVDAEGKGAKSLMSDVLQHAKKIGIDAPALSKSKRKAASETDAAGQNVERSKEARKKGKAQLSR